MDEQHEMSYVAILICEVINRNKMWTSIITFFGKKIGNHFSEKISELYLLDIENFPPKKSGIFSKKRKIEKKIPKKKN
jgi:hypothetical protein